MIEGQHPKKCHQVVRAIVAGDHQVGKTSLRKKLSSNQIPTQWKGTIDPEFIFKLIMVSGIKIRLELWDLPGTKSFRVPVSSYLKRHRVFVIMYDITNRESFNSIDYWLKMINQNSVHKQRVLFLVANKSDREQQRQVTWREGYHKAQDIHAHYVEVSCKNGLNLQLLLSQIAHLDMENRQ